MRKNIILIAVMILVVLLTVAICFAGTTFETKTHSYYGKKSDCEKLVVTIVPDHRVDPCDNNDVNSTAISTDEIYGELKRITIAATGTDVNFSVNVIDGMGVNLYSKPDCGTAACPLSYNLVRTNATSTNYAGIMVAGPITVTTTGVDPCNLTSITVALYYWNPSR